MAEGIDIVITWVDGNDQTWRAEKNRYSGVTSNDDIKRFRDWENLQFLFRGIEKYAPWIRYIHFVTVGHLPLWLNTRHPKLRIIKHEEFIPREYLPTFNSDTIEMNFHRIPGLSERFVYFNDDMFLMRSVKESDFFINGKPRGHIFEMPTIPSYGDIFPHILFNNLEIINRHFSKSEVIKLHFWKYYSPKYGKTALRNLQYLRIRGFLGFQNLHLPSALLKSTYQTLWDREEDILMETCANKFRSKSDVNQYLIQEWQWLSGEVVPQSSRIGKYYDVGKDGEKLIGHITKRKYKMVCINDTCSDEEYVVMKPRVASAFLSIFPENSLFEKHDWKTQVE